MYFVYVLRDEKGKMYKGMTNNLERRLHEHKSGHTKTTARMKNLSLVYAEQFDDFMAARKKEIYLKTAAGRRFLKTRLNMGL